ncbi:MAG TPA: carbonic anhydrase [Candidatus Angelobacter sp.]|nr:carbonic anhydrase [Candidatus Angelobacter sp.]
MRCLIRKFFHFQSPRERYKCDAAIVWCFDNRFEMALRKLIKKIGVVYFDPIRIAGGAKCLAGSESEADRQFVLDQIQKSVKLHDTDTVILMLHSDCGAYGGLQAFDNDVAREAEHHRQDLHRAVEFLQSQIPHLKVQAFFIDFEGVWEALLSQPKAKSA